MLQAKKNKSTLPKKKVFARPVIDVMKQPTTVTHNDTYIKWSWTMLSIG